MGDMCVFYPQGCDSENEGGLSHECARRSFYSSLISPLKSLCWLTPYVKTLGELGGGSRYKTQNIGSIIMSIDAPRDFSVENAYTEFDEFLRKTVADNPSS